ncbi:MAG: rRNA maturation RNase YbeY [Rhodospirillaceae bacterium]|jgi:probable rRNA maturation factor|nr:rRNA maturation RNase YbeY [Rhodospirillaceae bacterium]MBT5243059.1 rRNA maturation RNase YbeY [Rhodospirillaceae bacterium]MBT5563284.1 rRNA maturation RNase YbeY [Rhodospirillaceae bacterium]MBT6243598.1 rRNA maturation RNase YbeY [Rhodospirillaceae bacterium]MBT7136470.1 rRNA maturation RNase YbeY [Rhodospirillaceae bacterium]
MSELDIDVSISEPEWTTALGNVEELCRVAVKACPHPDAGPGEVSILLSDDEQVRQLNRDYRHQDKATNVLSFANSEDTESLEFAPRLLGDIVIAYGVTSVEAENEGKTLADHLTHLVIHGMLHLLGYDHQDDAEAGDMEALEVSTLAGLGIGNPYSEQADLK